MKLIGLFLVFFVAVPAMADDTVRQWTLRFPETRSVHSALTGCYGTSSYHYVLPTLETLRQYREPLRETADDGDLSGFAFSSETNAAGERLALDLDSGDEVVLSLTGSGEKGVVFCLCRKEWTHAKNCTSMPLPPLGKPFFADTDGNFYPVKSSSLVE